MYLVKTPLFIQKIYSSLTWKIDSDDSLYLSFDDGPDPVSTPWVLETLKSFNAKATFFCIGQNAEKYPELVEEIVSDGHTIGNHSYSHLSGWTTSTSDYIEDVSRCRDIVNSKLFRPPYGRLKPAQMKQLLASYKIVMWDIMCGDFEEELSDQKCLDNICSNAKAGSIVLLHDTAQSLSKLKFVLPELLQLFTSKDLKFKAIEC